MFEKVLPGFRGIPRKMILEQFSHEAIISQCTCSAKGMLESTKGPAVSRRALRY